MSRQEMLPDILVKDLKLDSKCRLTILIKNSGKKRISSADLRLNRLLVRMGKKKIILPVSKYDPRGVLAVPDRLLSVKTGILIEKPVSLTAVVDSTEIIRESNEINNELRKKITPVCSGKETSKLQRYSSTENEKKSGGKSSRTHPLPRGSDGIKPVKALPTIPPLEISSIKKKRNEIIVIIKKKGKAKLTNEQLSSARLVISAQKNHKTWPFVKVDRSLRHLNGPQGQVEFHSGIHLTQPAKVEVRITGRGLTIQRSVYLKPSMRLPETPDSGEAFVQQKKKRSSKKRIKFPTASIAAADQMTGDNRTTALGSSLLDRLPGMKILYFKEKKDTTGLVFQPGDNSSSPDSMTIVAGEVVPLKWSVELHDVNNVETFIEGGSLLSPVRTGAYHTASDGTRTYDGEYSFHPTQDTRYILTAKAQSNSANVTGTITESREFTVRVRRPDLTVLPPVIDSESMTARILARNDGDGDFLESPVSVRYEIRAIRPHSSNQVSNSVFSSEPVAIAPGETVELGTISLNEFRDILLDYPTMQIDVSLYYPHYPVLIAGTDLQHFLHNWETRTIELSHSLLSLLTPLTTIEIELNNYLPERGGLPEIRDDSRMNFTIEGITGGGEYTFDIPSPVYVVRESRRVSGTHHTINIESRYAIYIDHITSANGVIQIRDGKIVIHIEFPNSGSSEIKLGRVSGGNFDDEAIPDIDLESFSVDVALTPTVSSGTLSYGAIDINVPVIDARVSGSFHGLNGFIRIFLRDYVTNTVRNQLNTILNSASVKTMIKSGLASVVNFGRSPVPHVVRVRGVGDTITIYYH
ncbi:hypothetical protein [Desulfomarina profundi]|nr:hypothetical protein [Desulfomarina profundi]